MIFYYYLRQKLSNDAIFEMSGNFNWSQMLVEIRRKNCFLDRSQFCNSFNVFISTVKISFDLWQRFFQKQMTLIIFWVSDKHGNVNRGLTGRRGMYTIHNAKLLLLPLLLLLQLLQLLPPTMYSVQCTLYTIQNLLLNLLTIIIHNVYHNCTPHCTSTCTPSTIYF